MNTQKYSIFYEEEALRALENIGLHYEEVGGEELKIDILTRIQASIQTLDFMPERNQISDFSEKVRRLPINNLPYVAFYTLQANRVHVLEILHTKRDQNFLQGKYQDF